MANNVYVVYEDSSSDFYIKSYDGDGALLDTWTVETTENIGNPLAVDINNNVYTLLDDQHSIKKRNSSGVLTLTKTETNWIYNIAIGPDGYLYTQEYDAPINSGYISKRNTDNLVSVDTMNLGSIDTYHGLTIDADGDFYLLNSSSPDQYERWDWNAGLVSSVAASGGTFNSLGVSNLLIADVDWFDHALTRAKDLSGGETDVNLEDMYRPCCVSSVYGEYFLFSGYSGSGIVALGKYDTTLTKVWTVTVESSASYGPVGSYPFGDTTVAYDFPLYPAIFPLRT